MNKNISINMLLGTVYMKKAKLESNKTEEDSSIYTNFGFENS